MMFLRRYRLNARLGVSKTELENKSVRRNTAGIKNKYPSINFRYYSFKRTHISLANTSHMRTPSPNKQGNTKRSPGMGTFVNQLF